ncbi:MAG TPA: hypothetical protein VME66_02310 [Candidatus Acidoferrales bacterium]|nr:hypothetical protein [Candidatus Acidoferrales bacterium]
MSDTATTEQAPSTEETAPKDPSVQRGTIESDAGFLPADRLEDLRHRWSDVQASFVDDPRSAVQQANDLVAQIVDELTQLFTQERTNLEGQWNRGEEADTEALRVALQRYRAFFNRLLAAN